MILEISNHKKTKMNFMASDFVINDDLTNMVLQTISNDDGMIVQGVPIEEAKKHYFDVSKSALRCIRTALAAADNQSVKKILDFPCGHGRVMRSLRAAFPDSEIHGCDLLTTGVDFCKQNFNAIPISSNIDPHKIKLKGPYDLIWVGSLFTHFDANNWLPFLDLFHQSLNVGGICVITTHGEFAASLIQKGDTGYGLHDPGCLLTPFKLNGFAYGSYNENEQYGISLSSLSWCISKIKQLKSSRIILALEKGWADHQDVISWQKTA